MDLLKHVDRRVLQKDIDTIKRILEKIGNMCSFERTTMLSFVLLREHYRIE